MRLVFSHVLWARCVLLSLPFLAPWANFLGAQLKPPAKGRRTPWSAAGPLASLPRFEPAPAPFAACRHAGQAILPVPMACGLPIAMKTKPRRAPLFPTACARLSTAAVAFLSIPRRLFGQAQVFVLSQAPL